MGMVHAASDSSKISDGYHTFGELYDHRCHLFIALMLSNPNISWRARKHHDGTSYAEWFIAGMNLPTGQITYHLPNYLWDLTGGVETMESAPQWDGHTPGDVIKRLYEWCATKQKEA